MGVCGGRGGGINIIPHLTSIKIGLHYHPTLHLYTFVNIIPHLTSTHIGLYYHPPYIYKHWFTLSPTLHLYTLVYLIPTLYL